jgi:hypothetical protein
MKLNAHPMVVAVALGLLGPGALLGEDEEATCESSSGPAPTTTGLDGWQPGAPPDPEEFHRVAVEWEIQVVRPAQLGVIYCSSPALKV